MLFYSANVSENNLHLFQRVNKIELSKKKIYIKLVETQHDIKNSHPYIFVFDKYRRTKDN